MAEVLVVDDIPRNLEIIMQVLSRTGIEVSAAVSGTHALAYLKRRRPDLILLDIAMPDLDGITLCRQLKADPETADIPVIFLTAKVETEDVIRGFEAGAVDYVRKPFVVEELLSRVTTHLQLRESFARIQRQNREKDRYFSILAHDLRNPLSGFLNITEMLQLYHGDMNPEKIEEYLGLLKDSSRGLVKLLENLLTWSRVQIGALKPRMVPLNLGDIVDATASVLRPSMTLKEQQFFIDRAEGSPATTYGDTEMISTVVRNLLSNAIKFTPRGGSITVSLGGTADAVTLAVSDTGAGIDQQSLETIFEMGQTRSHHGTEGEKGTGLGLPLCHELVSVHHGSISVDSTPGKGTIFQVILPVSAGETGDAEPAGPSRKN